MGTFVEGEGAAAAQVAKHHLHENCLVVSNDTDSLLYMLLASLYLLWFNQILFYKHTRSQQHADFNFIFTPL